MKEYIPSGETRVTFFGLVALIAVCLNNPQGMDIIDAVIIYLTK